MESKLVKQLKVEEGFRTKPYRDSVGVLTIGYGHAIGTRVLTAKEHLYLFGNKGYPMSKIAQVSYWLANPMTKDQATFLLEYDIKIAEDTAIKVYGDHWETIPQDKRVPLIDLCYNLGENRYRGFRKHIQAVKDNDWNRAADEILNSLAAKQAPSRYKRLAQELIDEDPR